MRYSLTTLTNAVFFLAILLLPLSSNVLSAVEHGKGGRGGNMHEHVGAPRERNTRNQALQHPYHRNNSYYINQNNPSSNNNYYVNPGSTAPDNYEYGGY